MDPVSTLLGPVQLQGEPGGWTASLATADGGEPGVQLVTLRLSAPSPLPPPQVSLFWSFPSSGIQTRWSPLAGFSRNLPPNWGGTVDSSIASSMPLVQLGNTRDENRVTVAVSEAVRVVRIQAGVHEETASIHLSVRLFTEPEAPISESETTVRLDVRRVFYAEAIREASAWLSALPEYSPAVAPAAAFDPIYSSWYSYHQQVFEKQLEEECRIAAGFGMKGIIVDDGWQTEDHQRGYAFCGDWKPSKMRFADMAAHVARVHAMGMRYLLWYSVPFIGTKSENYARFKGKYLIDRLGASVLDPRFPEVREFLASTYEKALRDWDLDGFKLDFIESFAMVGKNDPAIAENYAGRDIRSIPHAVDVLFTEIMARLKAIKPDLLVEFRQGYIGPAIRKYGNMIRAGDCPADILANRVRTLDLRLTSGGSAVHADMLEWDMRDTAENAALQLLAVLFAVPQISVRIEELPESHRQMLRFWLDFWTAHRDTLMHGSLVPLNQSLNYPVVIAEKGDEAIVAVYAQDQLLHLRWLKARRVYLVNATGADELLLEVARTPRAVHAWTATGDYSDVSVPAGGLSALAVPPSGLAELDY